ncbi:MAG: class I SAM-dependent methyltransferase [Elusimicrobia bacterium]|nr:class I SAM-dependent methyltransferase [Candidatus Liberimonas magnetica]
MFKLLKAIKEGECVKRLYNTFINMVYELYLRIFKSDRINFNTKEYNYFYHWYNTTWRNERTIEIPIVWDMVKQNKDKEILEVGNVLSHYFKINHDVLDEYEIVRRGVIKKDIVDYVSDKKYDLIVSISTLEHIGYNYGEVYDENKIIKAIKNLKSMINIGGDIVVTLPVGLNKNLDNMISEKKYNLMMSGILSKMTKRTNGAKKMNGMR